MKNQKNTLKEDISKSEKSLQQEDLSKNQDSKNFNYEKIELENTPFTIVKTPEGYFVTIGKYRISEGFEHIDEAKEDADRSDWERFFQVVEVIITAREEIKKIENLEVK